MEDALARKLVFLKRIYHLVLILVVMEDALALRSHKRIVEDFRS